MKKIKIKNIITRILLLTTITSVTLSSVHTYASPDGAFKLPKGVAPKNPVGDIEGAGNYAIVQKYIDILGQAEKDLLKNKSSVYPELSIRLLNMEVYNICVSYLKIMKEKLGTNMALSQVDLDHYLKRRKELAKFLLYSSGSLNTSILKEILGKEVGDDYKFDNELGYLTEGTDKDLINEILFATEISPDVNAGGKFVNFRTTKEQVSKAFEKIENSDDKDRLGFYIEAFDRLRAIREGMILQAEDLSVKLNWHDFQDYGDAAKGTGFDKYYQNLRQQNAADLSSLVIKNLVQEDTSAKDDLEKIINLEVKSKPQVRPQYIYMLAATSIYTPLKSACGNDEYIDVIRKYNPNMVLTYNFFASKRKPLLKVESNNIKSIIKNENFTYPTSVVTLREIKNSILNGEKNVYVTGRTRYDSNGFELDDKFKDPSTGKEIEIDKNVKEEKNEADKTAADSKSKTDGSINDAMSGGRTDKKPEEKKDDSGVNSKDEPKNANEAMSEGKLSQKTKEFILQNEKTRYSKVVFATGFWDDDSIIFKDEYDNKLRSFNLMNMILYNAFQESFLSNKLLDCPVYMDFLGNIVLQDNTVLLPAMANTALYGSVMGDPKKGKFKDGSVTVLNRAFLDTYPKLSDPKDVSSLLTSGNENKYSLKMLSGKFENNKKGEELVISKNRAMSTEENFIKSFKGTLDKAKNMFSKDENKTKLKQDKEYRLPRVIVLSQPNGSNDKDEYRHIFSESKGFLFLSNNSMEVENTKISFANMSHPNVNRFLADANYYYLTADLQDKRTDSLQNFISGIYMMDNVVIPAYNGLDSTEYFCKNFQKEADKKELTGWVKTIGGWINGAYDFCKNTKGILGLEDVYANKILGPILEYSDKYVYILAILLFVLYIFKYIKTEYTLGMTISVSIISTFIVVAGLTVVPKYVPEVYNMLGHSLSHDLSMSSYLFGQEQKYYSPDKVLQDYKEGSTYVDNKYALTLYKFSDDKQYEAFKNNYDIVKADLNKPIVLDSSEIFLLADKLKVNVDDIFRAYKVYPETLETGKNILTVKKTYEPKFDYYMPYSMIMNQMVSTLNDYLEVTSPERHSYRYGDVLKEAFVCNSFFTSGVFIGYPQSDPKYEKDMRNVFKEDNVYPMIDFLRISKGLSAIQTKDIRKERDGDSLWFTNVEKVAKESPERLAKKIKSINDGTRLFILNNKRMLASVSDENFIKIVALYATIEFNRSFSEFQYWLSPFSPNYGEIVLNDVYQVILPPKENIFSRESIDVANYAMSKGDIWGMLFLGADVCLSYANSLIINILYAMSYLVLVAGLILKFAKKDGTKPLLLGFFRLCAMLVIAYYLNIVFYYLIRMIDDTMIKLIILFVFNFIIFDSLLIIIGSLRYNFFNLGYGFLGSVASKQVQPIKNLMNRGRISNSDQQENENSESYEEGNNIIDMAKGIKKNEPVFTSEYMRSGKDNNRYKYEIDTNKSLAELNEMYPNVDFRLANGRMVFKSEREYRKVLNERE